MLLTQKHIISKSRTLIIVLLLAFYQTLFGQDILVQRKVLLMGSVFNFTVVDKDQINGNKNIDKAIAEVTRIENLISEWKTDSQISEVNRNAGIRPVIVEKEVFDLTERAIQYSEMSDGAFDISTAALDKIWRFDGSMTQVPSKEDIAFSVRNVGYKSILLDRENLSIFLLKKDMKIGFGSIGKGYAADKARLLLQDLKVKSGIVDASGDIATWGSQINGKPWAIGIKNPFKKNKIARVLRLQNSAVATSGSYEKYAEINEIRYSHIINPKTGFPAAGLTSVTIYGPSAEFSNALSTSIMVLGRKVGKRLVKKFPNYKFLLITDKGKIIK